jgi:translation initiation factor 2 beta subunit (eIF-2beta)/eIF-5
MKKISHAIVLVEDIESSLPRSKFLETDLDEAARLLLKTEGVITPPILLETGIDSYKLIEGDFEYYAAIRAGEIDPLSETINAYIIKDEEEVEAYKKQIEVFRQQKSLPQSQPPVVDTSNVSHELQRELKYRDNMLHDAIKQMGNQIAIKISEELKNISSNLEEIKKRLPEDPKELEQQLLEELNTLPIIELKYKLTLITRKNIRENIIKERDKSPFQPFHSRHELIERIGGLAQKSFNIMLEKYNNLT